MAKNIAINQLMANDSSMGNHAWWSTTQYTRLINQCVMMIDCKDFLRFDPAIVAYDYTCWCRAFSRLIVIPEMVVGWQSCHANHCSFWSHQDCELIVHIDCTTVVDYSPLVFCHWNRIHSMFLITMLWTKIKVVQYSSHLAYPVQPYSKGTQVWYTCPLWWWA